jgi:hypothetical protein
MQDSHDRAEHLGGDVLVDLLVLLEVNSLFRLENLLQELVDFLLIFLPFLKCLSS